MKIELDVEMPEGYEIFGSKRGNVCTEPDGITRVYVEIILRKKKRKVIVFVPDAEGTHREVLCSGVLYMAKYVPALDGDDGACQRYRREEREEA